MMRFLLILLFTSSAFADLSNLHTRFKDPAKIKRFNAISKELRCQCGCNLALSGCNHPATCTAWSLRAVIEGLIEDGKSNQFIINGFKNGFGKLAREHAAFAKTREIQGYTEALSAGFGTAALSIPENDYSNIFLILLALAMLGLLYYVINRRLRPLQKEQKVGASKSNNAELYDKLYED